MTFLELCRKLRLAAGISGTGPSTVENAQGQHLELATWINQAWQQIQTARTHWHFMWSEFSFTTTPGQRDYSGAEVGAPDLAQWGTPIRRYPLDQGAHYEGVLEGLAFPHWQQRFGVGVQRDNPPVAFTLLPDNRLRLAPTPDGEYVISGPYYRDVQLLVQDSDVPRLPLRYHDLILYLALMLYGLHQEAPSVITHGQTMVDALYPQLEREQLPPIEPADSLAFY